MASRHAVEGLAAEGPFLASLERASRMTSQGRVATVIVGERDAAARDKVARLSDGHLITQPEYRGTAFEVLLALLWLEQLREKAGAVVFLPCNHLVNDETAMTASLCDLVEWIITDSSHVYLLGAYPQDAVGAFGYIVPWNDSWQVPASVYEFVESPDTRQAQKLMNAGALLNTFIFGGTVSTMLSMFSERFGQLIPRLRAALRAQLMNPADEDRLKGLYSQLADVDFSMDLLTTQTDRLKVLRMANCGWRPANPGRTALGPPGPRGQFQSV